MEYQSSFFSRTKHFFHEHVGLVFVLALVLTMPVVLNQVNQVQVLQQQAQFYVREYGPSLEAPTDCEGNCYYNWDTGQYMRREADPAGGARFSPCQSATSCGGSSSGSSGSSSGSSGAGSSGSGSSQASCATAAGCSYKDANGNQVFCADGRCTECTSSGSCGELPEARYPNSIPKPPTPGWSGSNQGSSCIGPGCAPGTVPPTSVGACTPNCTGNFPVPDSNDNGLPEGNIVIGGTNVYFNAGSNTSVDGKYTRTCTSAGSCTVTPVNSGNSAQPGQTGGGIGPGVGSGARTVYFDGANQCGGASVCRVKIDNTLYDCSVSSGAAYSCTVSQANTNNPNATYRIDLYVPTSPECASSPQKCVFTGPDGSAYSCGQTVGAFYACDVTVSPSNNTRQLHIIGANGEQRSVIDPNARPGYQAPAQGGFFPGQPMPAVPNQTWIVQPNVYLQDVSPYCGDGVCNGSENPSTCAQDCGGTSEIVCSVTEKRLMCE